jgi:hypothetical protein
VRAENGDFYLAKVHALDSFASQCWADWRTGTSLSGSYDQFHKLVVLSQDLAGHVRIFSPGYTKFIGCCINGLKSDSRSAGDEGRGWTEAEYHPLWLFWAFKVGELEVFR